MIYFRQFSFLLALILLLTSACSGGEQESEPQTPPNEPSGEALLPDPGVVSYSFRNQFSEDVPATLDLIKEMGVTNIEFSSLFGQSAEDLRAMLDERGMVATSYGVGFQAVTDEIDRVIEEAHTLGVQFVRIGSVPYDRSGPFTIDDAQRAVEAFNEIGARLQEADLKFIYHNHGFEFRPHEEGTLFDYMVQNTDPETVGYEMDLGWVVQPGHDPVELVQRYPDRFWATHLKDFRHGTPQDYSGSTDRSNSVMLGNGMIDFAAFLRAAEGSNIVHHYIEYEDEDVVDVMPHSLSYIRGLTK
ncbi:MAG: sugar phosphate isomerase/epimerase [Balneolaceae bacterium]